MQYPDYDPTLDSPPLADDELDALDETLRALPSDAAMNVEALDGYLTALLLGPRLAIALPAARWLPPVWGGDGGGSAPFASQKQKKRVVVQVLRHLHAIDVALRDPERWEPVLSVAETDAAEQVDAEDWCAGFLEAVALDAPAWSPWFDGPAMAPVARLGSADAQAQALDDAGCDRESRAAIEAVAALAAKRR